MLQEMWRSGLEPNVISYNAAMSACEKGQAVGERARADARKCGAPGSSRTDQLQRGDFGVRGKARSGSARSQLLR